MAIRLDEDGNINASFLEKELQSALDFDIKYKQTDSMKKRAVKVAGSYDEFKNMVACAHLKTLDRGEVDSLRHVKQGWKKPCQKKSDTVKLDKENDAIIVQEIDTSKIKSKKVRTPKTSMEFDRDWRRLKSSAEKHGYIRDIGVKKICKVLKHDVSAETLEQILDVLLLGAEVALDSSDTSNDDTSPSRDMSPPVVTHIDLATWLTEIISFDRFSLTLRLLDASLLARVVAWLDAQIVEGDAASLQQIRDAFVQ